MMQYVDLKGRSIEDVPFTGLIESISIISLISNVVGETSGDLTKDDLVSMISQINGEALKCYVYAGATREEVAAMTAHLLKDMTVLKGQSH